MLASATTGMWVMLPTQFGLTRGSMSNRHSVQSGESNPRVVAFLCLVPQPTCKKAGMVFV